MNTNEKGSLCGIIKSENTHWVSVCMIPDTHIIAVRLAQPKRCIDSFSFK